MEAVVKIGGRQYRVSEGQQLEVDRLEGEVGATLSLDQVLMLADGGALTVGTPLVEGAAVEARVLAATRGKKVLVYKYKAKKRYRRTAGQRAALSRIEVTAVRGPGRKATQKAGADGA